MENSVLCFERSEEMANFIGMFMIFLELNAREVEEEHMVSKNVEICWGNLKTSFYKQFQMVYF